jgi:hypothetical protein
MMRHILIAALAFFVIGCVTVPKPDSTDFSSLRTVTVDGLKLRVPRTFERFNENGAALFRPEPPVRPSPGLLIKRAKTTNRDRVLEEAARKVYDKMGGDPLAVTVKIGERETRGITAELPTHFIWIYVIEGTDAMWTMQIIAPIEWSDELALRFHDTIASGVRPPD